MGAQPVQKLRKNSELVQSGGRVHYQCIFQRLYSIPVRMSQGEDQVGELVLLEFGDKLFVLLVGELAGVVFKDSLGGLATGCVEENYCGNIIPVWFRDAGYLLGQNPTRRFHRAWR